MILGIGAGVLVIIALGFLMYSRSVDDNDDNDNNALDNRSTTTTRTPTPTTGTPASTTNTPASTTGTRTSTTNTPASTTNTPASTTGTRTSTTQSPVSEVPLHSTTIVLPQHTYHHKNVSAIRNNHPQGYNRYEIFYSTQQDATIDTRTGELYTPISPQENHFVFMYTKNTLDSSGKRNTETQLSNVVSVPAFGEVYQQLRMDYLKDKHPCMSRDMRYVVVFSRTNYIVYTRNDDTGKYDTESAQTISSHLLGYDESNSNHPKINSNGTRLLISDDERILVIDRDSDNPLFNTSKEQVQTIDTATLFSPENATGSQSVTYTLSANSECTTIAYATYRYASILILHEGEDGQFVTTQEIHPDTLSSKEVLSKPVLSGDGLYLSIPSYAHTCVYILSRKSITDAFDTDNYQVIRYHGTTNTMFGYEDIHMNTDGTILAVPDMSNGSIYVYRRTASRFNETPQGLAYGRIALSDHHIAIYEVNATTLRLFKDDSGTFTYSMKIKDAHATIRPAMIENGIDSPLILLVHRTKGTCTIY